MRLLTTVRAEGNEEFGSAILRERGKLGEGVVIVSRGGDEALPGTVRKLRGAGLSVIVLALATHTYRPAGTGERGQAQEVEFSKNLGRLEASGAKVLAVRHPAGVAGLSGARERTSA